MAGVAPKSVFQRRLQGACDMVRATVGAGQAPQIVFHCSSSCRFMPSAGGPGLTCNPDHQDDTWSAWTTSYETSLRIYGDALRRRRRFAGLRCANFCFPAFANSPSQPRSQRTHGLPGRRGLSDVDYQDNLDYTDSLWRLRVMKPVGLSPLLRKEERGKHISTG